MRRWNGWGEESVKAELPEGALAFLRERAGEPIRPNDAAFEEVVAAVPPSRLRSHPLIDTSPSVRVLHARGQSLPDWLALRFGRLGRVPDGVAFPESATDVRELLSFAREERIAAIPYGGGTSVVGHIDPGEAPEPVLTIALGRMRRLLALDEDSRLATFEAGVVGPDLEAQLRARGYTLGHFPQSFEYSTLGGWIVTRSSGQQSLGYGRIEQTFAGGTIETPAGSLTIPTVPASAAGIDMRELVLGSEGRIGILTEATVRVNRLPAHESFHGWFFPSWERARAAVRDMVHRGVKLSMIRLANPTETLTTLRLASGGAPLALMDRYLSLRGARDGERCLLLAGVTGELSPARVALAQARDIASAHRGLYLGTRLGKRWERHRFQGVYLRNALWEQGYAVDTVETAVDWPRVSAMVQAIESAGREALGKERAHAYTHLSHVYPQGTSVYSTFVFCIAPTYEENLARWQALKRAIGEAIVRTGGTISHQHGVGVDHRPYLCAEKGALGLDAMRAVFRNFDPDGIMNPGKLV